MIDWRWTEEYISQNNIKASIVLIEKKLNNLRGIYNGRKV